MDAQVTTNITAKFSQFYFKNGHGWSPLPIWARFYLTLGSVLARFHEEKTRYVAALALPTKSHAIPLIGSGLAYANNFLYPDKNRDHLELIISLPDGTPVKYINKMGKLLNGIKREVVNNQGKISIGM